MTDNTQRRATTMDVIKAWNQDLGIDLTFGHASDLVDRLEAAAPVSAQQGGKTVSDEVSPRWRHKKSGTTYVEIGRGELQASENYLVKGSDVVVYRSEHDGRLWVRASYEFEDGRFESISPLSMQPQKGTAPFPTPPVSRAVPDEVRGLSAAATSGRWYANSTIIREHGKPDRRETSIFREDGLYANPAVCAEARNADFIVAAVNYVRNLIARDAVAQPQVGNQPATSTPLLAPDRWEPISTAPTDGCVLLGYSVSRKGVLLIRWNKDFDAWCEASTGVELFKRWEHDDRRPTHWHPLPALPVVEREADR